MVAVSPVFSHHSRTVALKGAVGACRAGDVQAGRACRVDGLSVGEPAGAGSRIDEHLVLQDGVVGRPAPTAGRSRRKWTGPGRRRSRCDRSVAAGSYAVTAQQYFTTGSTWRTRLACLGTC